MIHLKNFIKKEFHFTTILLFVLFLTSLRVFLEWWLLCYYTELSIYQYYVRFYLENVYYFLIVFIAVAFMLSKILGTSLTKAANFGLRLFPVVLLPPLVDFFIFKRVQGYSYATTKNFFYNFLTLSLIKGDASPGITFEAVLIFISIFIYVLYIKKSFLLSLLAGVLTSLITVIISTPDIFFGSGGGDYYYDYFLPNYYFFPLLIFTIVLCYYYNKEKLKAILSNLRLLKSSMFVIFALLGSIAAKKLGYNFDIYRAFLASMIPFFGWQFSIIINDVHDIGIDRISNKNRPLVKKILTEKEYLFIGWTFAFFALSLAAILNIKIFILTIIALFFGIVYSSPPLRLRNNLLGNLVMGVSLVITFMIGLLIADNSSLLINKMNLIYFTLLFIFGAVATLAKDAKDIKSDSKHGVKNIYTIFGKHRGKIIVIILLFFVSITPSIIFKDAKTLFVSMIVGLANCFLYYKKEDEKLVYVIFALLLVYIFVRIYYA